MKTTRSLVASLLLNVVLLVLVACLASQRTSKAPDQIVAVTPMPTVTPSAPPAEFPSHVAPSAPAIPAFHWSQIESADLPAYLANLRAIDCPENIVRDIITTAVAHLYDRKRSELQSGAHMGAAEATLLRRRIEELHVEESGVIESLLGPLPVASAGVTSMQATESETPANGLSHAQAEIPPAISIPLVLLDPDPDLQLNEAQTGALSRLRQNFVDAVSGASQDPTDPEYLRRWQKAQEEMDAQFASLFGQEAYQKEQIRAARQLASQTPQ